MSELPPCVIVVGASGFVGRNIIDALNGSVEQLIAVTARTPDVAGSTRTVRLDDLDTLPTLPERCAIIHVATMRYDAATFKADQPRILDENLRITNAVYAFAAARNIREIRQASSAAIYPASFDILDDERPFTWNEWPHEGEAAYAWSKRWGEIIAEHYRRNHGIHTISFRLSNPYGPYDTTDISAAHVATAFALRALEPGPEFLVRGNPNAERDFVFAGDVADIFKRSLAVEKLHDSLNLGYGMTITVRDLAEAAVAASGQMKRIVVDNSATGGVAVRRMSTAKLQRLFPDFVFRSPRDGFGPTLDWYRRHA